jgi:hypothetical protein
VDLRAVLKNVGIWKFLSEPGLEIRPLVVQPVVTPYTDCSTADLPLDIKVNGLTANCELPHIKNFAINTISYRYEYSKSNSVMTGW